MIKKKSTYNTKVFRCSQPLWMIFIYFLSMQLQDNADHKCDACIYYLMFILEIVLTNAFWDAIKCFQFFITWMAACHGKMQRQSFIGNLYVFCVYWNCLRRFKRDGKRSFEPNRHRHIEEKQKMNKWTEKTQQMIMNIEKWRKKNGLEVEKHDKIRDSKSHALYVCSHISTRMLLDNLSECSIYNTRVNIYDSICAIIVFSNLCVGLHTHKSPYRRYAFEFWSTRKHTMCVECSVAFDILSSGIVMEWIGVFLSFFFFSSFNFHPT